MTHLSLHILRSTSISDQMKRIWQWAQRMILRRRFEKRSETDWAIRNETFFSRLNLHLRKSSSILNRRMMLSNIFTLRKNYYFLNIHFFTNIHLSLAWIFTTIINLLSCSSHLHFTNHWHQSYSHTLFSSTHIYFDHIISLKQYHCKLNWSFTSEQNDV